MYMQIRLPLVCLLILIYCWIFYSRKKKLYTRTSNVFGILTVVAMIHLLAATVTEYTVNHRDMVPEAFNYVWHIVFLVSLMCLCSIILFYMLVYVERAAGKRMVGEKYSLFAVNMIGCVLELFLPISYIDTPYGSYSLGPKAYVLYVVLATVIVRMMVLLARFRKVIGQEKSKVLFATAFVFIFVSVIQVIWPHILLTGPAVTAIVLGIMVNTEDAHLYVHFKTGFYNELGCREILQEKLLIARPFKISTYVFLGSEEETLLAMRKVENAYNDRQKQCLSGVLWENMIIIMPPLKYAGTAAHPEMLYEPDFSDLDVKYECKAYEFSGKESVDEIYERLRNQKSQFEEEALQRDELTGVLRRSAFIRQTEYLISQKISFALLMLDLDDFKDINDTFGHHVGDAALKYVADVLKREVRSSDVVCRMGGDEFAVVLFGVVDKDVVNRVLSRMMDSLARANYREEGAQPIQMSVGVKLYHSTDGDVSFQELYAEADGALYRSKYSGKGCVTFAEFGARQ